MNTNQHAIAGYNRLAAVFNSETAIAAPSVTTLSAESGRLLSNREIIKILLRQDDKLTTFSGSGAFTGFKISKTILRLV